MHTPGDVLIAFVIGLTVAPFAFVAGFYLLLMADPHFHDGYAFTGGIIIGMAAGVLTFIRIKQRLAKTK